jgi:lysozyme family protein
MADVNKSWRFVLSNEDSNPPSGRVTTEPGGAMARLGVNSAAWPEAVSDGFYSMSLADALQYAEDLFKYHYWSALCGYSLVSNLIAAKWSDLAYNGGVKESTLLVQRAANTLASPALATDGICGDLTVARVNMLCGEQEEALYDAIIAQGVTFYEELRAERPEEYSAALEAAWLDRLRIRPPV